MKNSVMLSLFTLFMQYKIHSSVQVLISKVPNPEKSGQTLLQLEFPELCYQWFTEITQAFALFPSFLTWTKSILTTMNFWL